MKKWMAVAGIGAFALACLPIGSTGASPADDPAGAPTKDVPVSDTGSYIVVLTADPLVPTIAPELLGTPAAEAKADALDASHDQVLREVGASTKTKVQDFTNAVNGFSAILSHEAAERLAGNPKVALVIPDVLRTTSSKGSGSGGGGSWWDSNDDASTASYLGISGRNGLWSKGINGTGVTVGVIDSGIWPEQPMFADDGTLAPHTPLDTSDRSACEFGSAVPGDVPFTCNNKLVGARSFLDTYGALTGFGPGEYGTARDDEGHGTHTASTAAGNANVRATIFGRYVGTTSGIAPKAQIIAYKALGALGGYTSDIMAAIDQAIADGVDVINYSVGGGPSLIGGDAIEYLFAADAGIWVATSAGNDGPGASTIGGPADVPWVTAVGANTQKRFYEGSIRLDNGQTFKGSSITRGTNKIGIIDAGTAGSELCIPGDLDPSKVAGKIVLCRRGGNGRIDKSLAVSEAGGAGMVLYNNSNDDNLFSDNFFVPTVMVDNSVGLKVKSYIAKARTPKASLVTGNISTWQPAPSMTIFSSRGPNPTAESIIKPDITAPGLQILAGNTPMPSGDTQPSGQLFQAIAGTSMSSPQVAGIYALLRQVHPDWSSAAAKSALMTTANTKVVDNNRKTQAGPFAMGAGEAAPGKPGQKNTPFDPGIVYDAGTFDYLGFGCDTEPLLLAFVGFDPVQACAQLADLGVPTRAVDLNYPSIGVSQLAGSETIVRTITSVASKKITLKAEVKAPKGYKVTVSPSTITLQPGASATFTMSIVNNGKGTPGEWRDGSLTWRGSGYAARSAIAVKGTQLAAPAEVDGTGATGTAAIPLKFGYTGTYVPAVFGLVPSAPIAGTIDQDPDATFPSGDDGSGVDLIPIHIAGSAYFRLKIVVPGDLDLDLYLFDGDGNVVAQSTSAGTDEQIDLVTPADGDYTLVVHGWAVPAPATPYSIDKWDVPLTGGGSLAVVPPVPAAVTATSGTLTVGWSGLAPGEYLGAVIHTDGTQWIGVTAVDVVV